MNMKPQILFQNTKFLTSAATTQQFPPDEGIEVAFIGRSNAGKSSALNAIIGLKNLARTSKTPGRTQLLNFFVIDDKRRLVDLPGYGYAKVPDAIKQRWQKTIEHYLSHRKCLRGLFLVTDIRHPLNTFDQQIIAWTTQIQLPTYILLTKADKLSSMHQKTAFQQVTKTLSTYPFAPKTQLFSAKSGLGNAQAQDQLSDILSLE